MLSPPEKSLMSYEGIEVPLGGPASIWPQAPDDKDDQWQMAQNRMTSAALHSSLGLQTNRTDDELYGHWTNRTETKRTD